MFNTNARRCVSAMVLIGLLSACGGSDTPASGAASTSSSTASTGTATTPSSSTTSPGSTASAPTGSTTTTTAPASSSTTTSSSKTAPTSTPPTASTTLIPKPGTTSTLFEFANPAYAVMQSVGSVTVTATRSGSSGAASVSYATSNGTAKAGQNFTAQSGTLSWADGDATAKNIVVPVSSSTIGKAVVFSVTLSNPSDATVGSPGSTLVTINPSATSTASVSVSVSGNKLIDAQGTEFQLRGVNVSGLEGSSFENDPWRGQKPNFAAMKTWGINVVRLPLAEANWLGLCSISLNAGVTPAVYQAAIQAAVSEANALGIYVILDLHIIAVPNLCPNGQNAMADTTYSAKFWSEVATAFKGNPAVMFELFNEPQGNYPPTTNDWNNYLTGGLDGPQDTGAQQLLNAIRAAGATNVVLVDTLNYASTFGNNNPSQTGFTDNEPGFHLPTDTLSTPQLVAVQHYYNTATKYEQGANDVLNKNIPIILTEYGDADGTTHDTTAVYGWADPGGRASQALTSDGASFPGVSYVAWTWNFGYGGWSLISDSNGDLSGSPYAAAVKAHYQSRAGL
jgi:endoglucanase